MFGGWFDKAKWPIGLEFASQSLRAVQLAWDNPRWKVMASATLPFPADMPTDEAGRHAALRSLLESLFAADNFDGRQVVTCLPASVMQYKNLRLPPMPAHELTQAIKWEAADRLKIDDQYQIQHFDAGEVRQGDELRREILLLAAPVRAIEAHVSLLQDAGLEPVAIDAAPAALARFADALDQDPEATQCVLAVHADSSDVLIARHGRVLFFKPIELGTHRMDEAIADRLSMPLADAKELRQARTTPDGAQGDEGSDQQQINRAVSDALRAPLTELAREIGMCLRYCGVTFRGQRPEAVRVVGDLACEPLLADLMPSSAGLAVAADTSASVIDWSGVSKAAAELAPYLAVAAGLSMRSRDQDAKRGAA